MEEARGKLVLIEPDTCVCRALAYLLEMENWQVMAANGFEGLRELSTSQEITAVVSETELPDGSARLVLQKCNRNNLPIIFTGHATPLQTAIDLIHGGAADFLEKPFKTNRLVNLLSRIPARRISQSSEL